MRGGRKSLLAIGSPRNWSVSATVEGGSHVRPPAVMWAGGMAAAQSIPQQEVAEAA